LERLEKRQLRFFFKLEQAHYSLSFGWITLLINLHLVIIRNYSIPLLLLRTNSYNMKKGILTLSFASLLLMACGGEKTPITETEVAEEVALTADSAAVEMHQATEQIEKSAEELDELLNDL